MIRSNRYGGPLRYLRAWVGGSDPGPMVVEVDPHIRSGDIEIPLDDLAVSRAATPTSPIDQVALDALLAQMGGKR